MKHEKEKESMLERAADVFELPAEVVAGLPKVTVTGTSRVHIENHKGILEYGDAEIAVNCGKMILRVMGTGLELCSMNAQELLIVGTMTNIVFEQ